MPNSGLFWTPLEDGRLSKEGSDGFSQKDWDNLGLRYRGRSGHSVRQRYKAIKSGRIKVVIPESPYPRYDAPLEHDGDALVIPDPEFPYHDHEFLNKCLELADAWKIKHCVIPGDALHFNSLSAWEPAWSAEGDGDMVGPNLGKELQVSSAMMRILAEQFKTIDWYLGNHEGRMIRTLGTVFSPDWMVKLLGLGGKWRIAPYYFGYVISGGQRFLLEHPKNAAKNSALKLADKYECHVLMAHSHKMNMQPSASGKYMAWQIGACVDETRLPYASQRHNAGDVHSLGAAIIRDGYVWVLNEQWTDWERLRKAA